MNGKHSGEGTGEQAKNIGSSTKHMFKVDRGTLLDSEVLIDVINISKHCMKVMGQASCARIPWAPAWGARRAGTPGGPQLLGQEPAGGPGDCTWHLRVPQCVPSSHSQPDRCLPNLQSSQPITGRHHTEKPESVSK